MILFLDRNITEEQREEIRLALKTEGLSFREAPPSEGGVLVTGARPGLDPAFWRALPGVAEVMPDATPFKRVGREAHPEDTRVRVGPVTIGGERIAVIAGPCAVESREQAMAVAEVVKAAGAMIFRGGAFKPRSSPYSFQGLGEEGLKILAEIRERTGLPVVSEITSPAQAEMMASYVDMLQIGARNMQNFELLKCVGRLGKPVMLKRGLSATIEEWLMSAEYILAEGNDQVVICERGIRTYEPYTRNTLDLSAIPIVKKLTHLPIIIDPSHATGMREKVGPMARAAVAAGADGVMVEVHPDPGRALSDGPQSLFPEQFADLMRDLYVIAPVVNKQVDFHYLEKVEVARERGREADGRKPRVVFQGLPGGPDHRACVQYFGDAAEPVSATSYREVYERVADGEARYGILPLEHSMRGSVHEHYDLLLSGNLKIVGEITLRIIHCLAAKPWTDSARIRQVFSDPVVFRHCDRFLDEHPEWQRVTVQDVATAARRVRDEAGPGAAAITTPEAAERYGLEVLERNVATNPRGYTRFAVLSTAQDPQRKPRKSTLVYQVPDRPGALLRVLTIFSDHRINLVKLESRPLDSRPWEYLFYVDVEADVSAPENRDLLERIREATDYLKILGCY